MLTPLGVAGMVTPEKTLPSEMYTGLAPMYETTKRTVLDHSYSTCKKVNKPTKSPVDTSAATQHVGLAAFDVSVSKQMNTDSDSSSSSSSRGNLLFKPCPNKARLYWPL